jgi:hypothetical protein
MFLAGPALSGRFCTELYRGLVLVLCDVALSMDSCVIKPAPLLGLQPGCLHKNRSLWLEQGSIWYEFLPASGDELRSPKAAGHAEQDGTV